MKQLFELDLITAWLNKVLPGRFSFAKKTPWYRRTVAGSIPLIAPALMAPFAAFLLWKVVSLLRGRSDAGTE